MSKTKNNAASVGAVPWLYGWADHVRDPLQHGARRWSPLKNRLGFRIRI